MGQPIIEYDSQFIDQQMLENNYFLHFKNRECVVSNPFEVELFYFKMINITFFS